MNAVNFKNSNVFTDGEHAWESLNKTGEDTQAKWLAVGASFLAARTKYPSNQAYGVSFGPTWMAMISECTLRRFSW